MTRKAITTTAALRQALLTLLLLAFLTAPALGVTFTAFGPQEYQRNTGQPEMVVTTFTVSNLNTAYTLQLINGMQDDDEGECENEGGSCEKTARGTR